MSCQSAAAPVLPPGLLGGPGPELAADPLSGEILITERALIGENLLLPPPGCGLPWDPLCGPVRVTETAVIGDNLRIPAAWCQASPCIARFTDPAALGEVDLLIRALRAGWREDALGRLACPACQQRKPFRATWRLALRNGPRPAAMLS